MLQIRFSHTNYMNEIFPVAGFKMTHCKFWSMLEILADKRSVEKKSPPALQNLEKFRAMQSRAVAADCMFHIYNAFIEAMNTNYSIRAIHLLLFMTSLV